MMPHEYGISLDGDIFIDAEGNPLTNFSVKQPTVYYASEDGRTPENLRLQLYHLDRWYTIDIDLRDPQIIRQIQQAIPTCKILKGSARAAIESYIVDLITTTGEASPPLYFRQHGFSQLPCGRYVFVAGDEVLGLPAGQKGMISSTVARAHLAYDGSLSCEQAVQKFWTVLKRDGDVVLPVWGFTLVSAMRSLLTGLLGSTYPSLVVTGKQGFGKTTVCQRFCLLYDDKSNPDIRYWAQRDMRSTSASVIETIDLHRDQVVLMDDGAKSISSSEVRERKKFMAEMLRFASNDTNRTKMGANGQILDRFCTAGVAFNCEYALDNPSDIGRTVTVHICQEMQDGAEIERTYAATVFRYFILWLLPRLDNALASLKENIAAILGSYQRLLRNRLMILWALNLFMCFAVDSMAVSEKSVKKLWKHAGKVCDRILNQQIAKINELSALRNISWYLLDGIQRGLIRDVTKKAVKKGWDLPQYYYISSQRDRLICIPSAILYRYLENETPLRFSSEKAMDQAVVHDGLIQPGEDGKVACTRIDNRRYLGLRRVDLLEAASKVCE